MMGATHTFVLFCVVLAEMSVTLGETAETVYGGIGKDVQLDPKVAGSLRSITWKKGNNKLAEWSPEFEYDYYGRCLTAGRCNLSETTGVLIMKELNPEDTGIYSAEINNKGIPKEFLLTVLEPVSKPNVNTSCNETQCILVCVGQETKFTNYNWKENNKPVKEGNTLVVEKSGDRNKRYTCVFSNPVSQEESDPVSEEDLFPDSPTGLILGIVISIVLLVILVVTLLLIRHFKPEWLEVIGAMIPFCKKPSEPPSMEPVAQNVPNANGQVEQAEQQPLLKKNSEDANTQDSSGGALPVNETENAVHDHIAQNQLPDDGITATPEENGEKGVEAPDTTDSQPTAPAATELEGLSPLEKTKQEAIVQDGSQVTQL